jgi:hypothetical protein
MKILIISQHIFPIQTPRSLRTTELVKEFSRQGHDVVVYAVLGKYNYDLIKEKYNIKIKHLHTKAEIRPYTSDGGNSRHFLDKVCGKLFGKIAEFPYIEYLFSIPKIINQEEKFDVLISIANPHQIHWGVAQAKLKYPKKFPKKWIADCGDPFMGNGTIKNHFQYFARYEKKFCKLCDFISVPHEKAKEGYYEEFRSKIRVIPQGFKFKLISQENKVHNKVITFAYSGVFLKDIRNPSLFLDYLSKVESDFKFIVYTPFKELIAPYQKILGDKLEIRDLVSRKELLKILASMDFLLNFENVNTPTAIPSKLIDYAIVSRPILSIHPNKIDRVKINDFFKRDYTKRISISNVEQYNISNVVQKFINLSQN